MNAFTPADDARADRRLRPGRRRRRRAGRDRHRAGPGLLRRRRPRRRRRRPSTPARAPGGPPGTVPRDGGGRVTLRIFECTKPVIAAMNGSAVGIGVTMTLPMDIRVLADRRQGRLRVRQPRHRAGGGVELVPAADRRHQPGARVVPDRPGLPGRGGAGRRARAQHPPADEVLDVAHGLAAEIVANAAPVSAALTRQMLWRMLGADHPMEAHKIDSRAIYSHGPLRRRPRGRDRLPREAPAHRGRCAPGHDLPDWYPWWEDRALRLSRRSVRPPHPPIGAPGVSRCGTWTRDPRIPSRRTGSGTRAGRGVRSLDVRPHAALAAPRHRAGVRGGRCCWPRAAGC